MEGLLRKDINRTQAAVLAVGFHHERHHCGGRRGGGQGDRFLQQADGTEQGGRGHLRHAGSVRCAVCTAAERNGQRRRTVCRADPDGKPEQPASQSGRGEQAVPGGEGHRPQQNLLQPPVRAVGLRYPGGKVYRTDLPPARLGGIPGTRQGTDPTNRRGGLQRSRRLRRGHRAPGQGRAGSGQRRARQNLQKNG